MRFSRKVEWQNASIYIGPSLIVLFLIAIYPMLYAIWTGFWDLNLHRPAARSFAGFENYIKLFLDHRFLSSLRITFLFTFFSVAGTMVLGFLLALLFEKPFKGKNTALALLTIPMVMAPVVSALIWKVFLLEPDVGIVNWFLKLVGIRGPYWVSTYPWALISVVIVNVWFLTPFVMLIMEAALSGLPKETLEAAMIDGAGYWKRVWCIIIPLLKAKILFTLVFRITIDYRTFDIIYTMTRGGPAFDTEMLSLWVYNVALRTFQMGYANAGAVMMMIIIGIICFLIILPTIRERGEIE